MTLSLVEGAYHEVSRATIFESVTILFAECDTILNEIPLHISFKGEKAIDAGGVSREMFSAFFEAVYANTLMVLACCVLLSVPTLKHLI